MIEHNIAALTRFVATPSRRDLTRALAGLAMSGFWSVLLGASASDAKKRRRRKRNKRSKRNKRQGNGVSSPPPFPCTPACAGKVCGDDGCGGSCGPCDAGQICSLGACVTGQGTCAAGEDICLGTGQTCGDSSSIECRCHTSMSNQTRCGIIFSLSGCGTCLSDEECAAANPGVAGVFCVKRTGENCDCGGFCIAPCPID
jgi:hypothetical protein